MFWFFGRKAYGILVPWPGIEPVLLALEGKVLTTGPPGKSLFVFGFAKTPTYPGYALALPSCCFEITWGARGWLITYKTSSPLNPPLTAWGELSLLTWYCCCLKFDLNNGMSSRNIRLFITSFHKSLWIKEELRRKSRISAGAHRVNCNGKCRVLDDLQLIRREITELWGGWWNAWAGRHLGAQDPLVPDTGSPRSISLFKGIIHGHTYFRDRKMEAWERSWELTVGGLLG